MKSNNLHFVYTHNVLSPQELLNRSHRVRTIGGDNYINHLNGLFIQTNGKSSLSLDQIYPLTTAVYATNRQCIAKRKNISSPLIKGRMVRK